MYCKHSDCLVAALGDTMKSGGRNESDWLGITANLIFGIFEIVERRSDPEYFEFRRD